MVEHLGDFLERFYRGCAALRAAQPHFGFNKAEVIPELPLLILLNNYWA